MNLVDSSPATEFEPEDEEHHWNDIIDHQHDWKETLLQGGSLRQVDLEQGVNGWASPPGNLFQVRGPNYFTKRLKMASADWLLKPLGVDWLKSQAKLDHVLARSDNRVMNVVKSAHEMGQDLKSFIIAVNLQVPGREHHSCVFYYIAEDPILPGSLLYRFIHEDDSFRNSRFKLINRIVRGPWIVKAAVGNHAACLLGKALTCHYLKGPNYLEIDVDIGSSTVANYILHLALGYVNSVVVDMAFLIESQSDKELPERILGAVRIAQIEMDSAVYVESQSDRNNKQVNASVTSSTGWCLLGHGFSRRGHGMKTGKVDDEQTNRHS